MHLFLMTMTNRVCKECGKTYTPPTGRRGNAMKYCSTHCRIQAREKQRKAKPYKTQCAWCGKELTTHHGIKYHEMCRRYARQEQIRNAWHRYIKRYGLSMKQRYFNTLGNSNLHAQPAKTVSEEIRKIRNEKKRLGL